MINAYIAYIYPLYEQAPSDANSKVSPLHFARQIAASKEHWFPYVCPSDPQSGEYSLVQMTGQPQESSRLSSSSSRFWAQGPLDANSRFPPAHLDSQMAAFIWQLFPYVMPSVPHMGSYSIVQNCGQPQDTTWRFTYNSKMQRVFVLFML